jgi:pSer/pThr/pTyr-binding forkhead associated (FHA) protein
MAEEQEPFADVRQDGDGFTIPALKWRELLFVGAIRADGDAYVRDPDRPLPPFRVPDLFPLGRRFEVSPSGARVRIRVRP